MSWTRSAMYELLKVSDKETVDNYIYHIVNLRSALSHLLEQTRPRKPSKELPSEGDEVLVFPVRNFSNCEVGIFCHHHYSREPIFDCEEYHLLLDEVDFWQPIIEPEQ